ncbi:carboxyl-terminal processing protease [Chryseobacterium sp. H1D6B]|uniref:S41 family peptidase n=1 Tax=Chryseobacterium sp. H1D6B TaxID=2940588 RepID=UPI0015CD117F|nr:S41 family peptidase [Chryseobacterium sp. H1D6B]MDH6254173.1 carboxyl-terminal processing protease [Chryseobacterium sp. H1D6B]
MNTINKLIFTFILLSSILSAAQTKKQVSELEDVCKTWGSLKYFHPEIAVGKHDWDSILIASISSILDHKDNNSFQIQIDKMFETAGKNTAPEFILDKNLHPYTIKNINHSWIEKSRNLTEKQRSELKFLFIHPYQGQNYYAQNNPDDDGNIITPNEKAYPDMKMPDRNYRLLGLFRFWNVINYYYPYKYATDKPWDKVLTDLIPEFIKADDIASYNKTVLKMAATIDDGHGGVYPFIETSVSGKYSPPFYFRLVNNKAVVTKIMDKKILASTSIQEGSVIEKVDGISIKKKAEEYWEYISSSNKTAKYKDLHKIILSSKATKAIYSGYNPDSSKFSSSVPLSERNFLGEFLDFFDMTSTVTSKKITNDIAYVYAANITSKNMDSIMLPLMNTKAIILDLRNYPQTMPSYRIADYFLDQPTVYSMMTRNDFRYPGLLVHEITNAGTTTEKVGKNNPHPYQGKLVLLVDYRTQSLPEFDCLILKTYKKTTIVGTQTAGADGNQTRMIFPGGYKISFSGLGIYGADDIETQRVGIKIDIPVQYTFKDFVEKKDPILERAVQFINTGK